MKNFKKEDFEEMSSVLALRDDWDDYLLEAKMRKRAAKKKAVRKALRKKAMKKLAEAYHYLALLEEEGNPTGQSGGSPNVEKRKLSEDETKQLITDLDKAIGEGVPKIVSPVVEKLGLSPEEEKKLIEKVSKVGSEALKQQLKEGRDIREWLNQEGFFKSLWNKVVAGFKFLGRPFTKIADFVKTQWNKDTHKWWRRIGIIAAALALVALLILGRKYIWAFLTFLGRIAKRGYNAVKNFFARIFGRSKSVNDARENLIDTVSGLYDM